MQLKQAPFYAWNDMNNSAQRKWCDFYSKMNSLRGYVLEALIKINKYGELPNHTNDHITAYHAQMQFCVYM